MSTKFTIMGIKHFNRKNAACNTINWLLGIEWGTGDQSVSTFIIDSFRDKHNLYWYETWNVGGLLSHFSQIERADI